MSISLRRELLRLLREDEEFRYMVLGYLGLDEVVRSIRPLQRQVAENTKAIRALQEEVAENTKAIRALQHQVLEHGKTLERHTRVLEDRWGLGGG